MPIAVSSGLAAAPGTDPGCALEEVEAAEKFVPKWIIRFEINLIDEAVSYNHISFERCVFLPVERPGYHTVMKMQRVNSVYRNELTCGSFISTLSKTSVNILFEVIERVSRYDGNCGRNNVELIRRRIFRIDYTNKFIPARVRLYWLTKCND